MGFVNGSSRSPGPRRSLLVRLALIFLAQLYCTAVAMAGGEDKPKVVGVLYVVHGAARTQDFSHFFDAAIQMGSYDASSPLYQTIWQSENWSSVVPLTDVERAAPLLGFFRKANFEFGRLGNLQPATRITEAQTASLQRELNSAVPGTRTPTPAAGWTRQTSPTATPSHRIRCGRTSSLSGKPYGATSAHSPSASVSRPDCS